MNYCRALLEHEFNEELKNFLNKTEVFKEITDLVGLKDVPGYYLMVPDEYSQVYVGRSQNIKHRIQSHWNKQKEFDRLIFGSKENSVLPIDSFKALDTTRIFVYITGELDQHEDEFINSINAKYLLNRTRGGTLTGLSEAIINGKTRGMPRKEN
ncbi:hypothetical protein ACSFXN_06920 [Planococcus sp. 1R117A]|uniref:hypothetical protein n=1 Tax=Planococcus sp. 1R117A TaxID=3447020 RepID=UPI003EDCA26E